MKYLFAFVMIIALPAMAEAKPLRVVALGDSLTSGYGLQKGEDYPSQLQTALRAEGLDVHIENAGVSGDTTEAGLARLEGAITGDKPDLVIVALGGNDMLRSIDPNITKQNLHSILQSLQDKDIKAVLYGMRAPAFQTPPAYRKVFNAIFEDLADEFDVELYPFFLEGVIMNPRLNQGDGIHPNSQGIAVMVEKTKDLIEDELD